MQEENNKVYKREIAKYIFVLDFSDGKVYKYNISNEDWNPDGCVVLEQGCGHAIAQLLGRPGLARAFRGVGVEGWKGARTWSE